MKNTNIWLFLFPPIICLSILIGAFIGRVSAGHIVQLEHPFATLPTDNDSQTDKSPGSSFEKININTADLEKLTKVPGIDKALAQKIISFRNTYGAFSRIEDIMRVAEISKEEFNDIAYYITVGGKE